MVPSADEVIRAAGENDIDALRRLLNAGADPSAKDSHGSSALSQAILKRQTANIQLLLEKGANPNIAGCTLLHAAIFPRSQPEAVKLLLDYGADIEAEDDDGLRALHNAVKQ